MVDCVEPHAAERRLQSVAHVDVMDLGRGRLPQAPAPLAVGGGKVAEQGRLGLALGDRIAGPHPGEQGRHFIPRTSEFQEAVLNLCKQSRCNETMAEFGRLAGQRRQPTIWPFIDFVL